MSTTVAVNPPSYVDHSSLHRSPSYSAEPGDYEQRLALAGRLASMPSGSFVKESKGGGVRLKLSSQEDNIELPVYGMNGTVEGIVELSRTEGVTSVEVKIEGRLHIKEIAEGGTSTAMLCLDTALLWIKNPATMTCPSSLRFSLALPSTFEYDGSRYPLPPSFYVKLAGLPGFIATIDYSVTAVVAKPNAAPIPKVKSKTLGIHIGSSVISTPFIYRPRSRPPSSLPPPIPYLHTAGFQNSDEWLCIEHEMASKSTTRPDIKTKLYVPASRIFCMCQPIPFHLTFESSAISLAAFLPFSPGSNSTRKVTRVQLMRQTTVDVRTALAAEQVKTDMWRIDCIGEGTFRRAGDGPSWMSFSGEIIVDESIKVAAFKAGGLTVKDCILFTVNPYDAHKSPFVDLRVVVPVKLATEPWGPTNGIGATATLQESHTPPNVM